MRARDAVLLTGLFVTIIWTGAEQARAEDPFRSRREKLVQEAIIDAGVTNPRVIQVMRDTPRHEFLPLALHQKAYLDMALPIGEGQTISSPFIVAFMTECLDPQPSDRVLEIGTGSGYQAAVLSPLVREVYTIEIVDSLARRAAGTLRRLGYKNVHVKAGDGYQGWPEHAPFDKIIVTCSPEEVPQPLVDQLKEGGLIVVPVGERYSQTLYLMRKVDGVLRAEALRPTLFVPMTGQAEAQRKDLPDPTNPQLINGGFEVPDASGEFADGWYYQRQMERVQADDAPEGQHYVQFRNSEPGQSSHLLQGFGVDGKAVGRLNITAWVKYQDVRPGRSRQDLPAVAVSFYDKNRREVGLWWMGPFRGTSDWRQERVSIPVPPTAREAIMRIGLFGATGEIAYDNLELQSVRRP